MMRKRARAEWLEQSDSGQELLRLRAERGAVAIVHQRLLEERDSLNRALRRSQEQLKDTQETIDDQRARLRWLQWDVTDLRKAHARCAPHRRVVVARDGTRVHFPQRPPDATESC